MYKYNGLNFTYPNPSKEIRQNMPSDTGVWLQYAEWSPDWSLIRVYPLILCP